MEKVKIKIDGKEFEAEKGKTILQVALENGIKIPYFCYHPRLSIAGACRMCIVYVENYKRLLIACNTRVEDGLEIYTDHPLVKENQAYILQALMTRHPLDCPICDKAGECDLQNHGAIYGPQEQIVPISALDKYRDYTDWESDFLEYYSNRCIVCYRCTRVCDEVIGAKALFVDERGFHSNIVPAVRPIDTSSCEMCGACVYVCPVGAIISKPFKFWTRSWLLKSVTTNCSFCPGGCDIRLEYGVGDWRSKEKVYRIKPTDNINVCARAFFGYDVFNENRLLQPEINGKKCGKEEVINEIVKILEGSKKVGIVLSPYLPNEVIETVAEIGEKVGASVTSPVADHFFNILDEVGDSNITIDDFKNYENFVIVSKDITSLVPVVSYYLKGNIYRIFGEEGARDEKLNPTNIEEGELKNIKGKTLLIVDPLLGYEHISKIIKGVKRKKDFDIFVVPRDFNALGLYRILKGRNITPFGTFTKALKEGYFETLIIFGEDIYDYLGEEEANVLISEVNNLIVSSPFSDGISERAHVKIPMALFGEFEGSAYTLMGYINFERFLPWSFDQKTLWEEVAKNITGEKGMTLLEGKGDTEKLPSVHLYRNNWITKRSMLLGRLYEKVCSVNA